MCCVLIIFVVCGLMFVSRCSIIVVCCLAFGVVGVFLCAVRSSLFVVPY